VLVNALAQAQEWQEAERVARSIKLGEYQAQALQELANALTQAGEREHALALWQEAERVARSIEDNVNRTSALLKLANALTQAGEREHALALWQEAERVARSIEDNVNRTSALLKLANALTQAGEREHALALWQEAERVARSIEDNVNRTSALLKLANALAQAGEREHALALWQEAEDVIWSTSGSSSPPKKKTSSPPAFSETIQTIMTSSAGEIISLTSSVITITGALITVANWWSKKQNTNSTNLQERSSQLSQTEIVAIRLRMAHGDDPEFEEWLTDPDRLKHYIDIFNQPSNSSQPLYVIFVQRNGKEIKVDVSKGSQDNLQLEELISYLRTDSTES